MCVSAGYECHSHTQVDVIVIASSILIYNIDHYFPIFTVLFSARSDNIDEGQEQLSSCQHTSNILTYRRVYTYTHVQIMIVFDMKISAVAIKFTTSFMGCSVEVISSMVLSLQMTTYIHYNGMNVMLVYLLSSIWWLVIASC